jgi:hypothetical protein
MINWTKIKRELIGNKILISSSLFIFFYGLYIAIPLTKENQVFLYTFCWFILFAIGFLGFLFLYQKTHISTEKFGCLLMCVFMAGMGLFSCFVCNKDLPTYIVVCNSWLGGVIALASIVLITFAGFIYLSLRNDR